MLIYLRSKKYRLLHIKVAKNNHGIQNIIFSLLLTYSTKVLRLVVSFTVFVRPSKFLTFIKHAVLCASMFSLWKPKIL